MFFIDEWYKLCQSGDIHKINNTKITTNFNLGEFFKGIPPARLKEVQKSHLVNILHMAWLLQTLRHSLFEDRAIIISARGGWRDSKTQQGLIKKGTGAKASQHLIGNAVDFNVAGLTPNTVQNRLINTGTKYCIGLGDSFTHLDRRLNGFRFNY